jgi:arylsulfatase
LLHARAHGLPHPNIDRIATYYDYFLYNDYIVYPVLAGVKKFMETFAEFPPAQHPDSFTIDKAAAKLTDAAGGAGH